MDKKTEKKFDNLLQGIVLKLSTIESMIRKLDSNKNEPNKFVNKILLKITGFLFTALIVIPVTFQINDTMNAVNSKLDYKITNLETAPAFKSTSDISYSRDNLEQKYSFSIHISGVLFTNYGKVKDIYFVYTENEHEALSESSFHTYKFKNENLTGNYIARAIPLIDSSKFPLQKFSFSQNMSFIASQPKLIKPVYVVIVDKYNDIDISLLLFTGEKLVDSKSNMPQSIISSINLDDYFKLPEFKFYASQDFLKAQNIIFANKGSFSPEQFHKDSQVLSSIIRKYYIFN